MTKERRLGRGLEALLGRPLDAPGEERPTLRLAQVDTAEGAVMAPVAEIDSNPFQPRGDFDEEEIRKLADSLKSHGLLQPLVVRRVGPRFQLIAGERRLRAAVQAGWTEVPAQVREADDRQMAEIAIVENLQRRDLNALEKAASFQSYLARFRCTQEELAQRLSLDRSTVSNLIRLLELPTEVQQALRKGALTQGHARALLPLGDEREQIAFAARIVQEGLSVRATEELVGEMIRQADDEPLADQASPATASPRNASKARPKSGHLRSLEQELRTALGTRVDLRQGSQGRGKLVVHFHSHEEFERLRQLLVSVGSGERGRSKAG